MKKYFVMLALGLIPVIAPAQVVLDDFESGVTAANHPAGAGAYGTWYDVTYNAYATITADTFDGSAAANITDGGFTNGVYAIFDSPVPTDGNYKVTVKMHITEDAAHLDAIHQYQIGVKVNGVHRGDGSTVLDSCDYAGNYAGLTDGDDSGLEIQTVSTETFAAVAGDDILIAFSSECKTDSSAPTAGPWNDFAGTFGTPAIMVDNITLVPDANVSDWNLY